MKRPRAWFRLLLRLYPERHRRQYGEEMWEVVRHRVGDARGVRRAARLIIAAADLAWNAVRVRAAAWARRLEAAGWALWRNAEGRADGRRGAGADAVTDAASITGIARGRGGAMTGMGPGRGWGLDIRFVARSLARSPGYALTVVVVLAGAVAVNAAVFSFVRGTLLPTPTYPGADRVVLAWGSNTAAGQLRDVVSGPNFLDLRRRTSALEALAAFHGDAAVLFEEGRPLVLDANSVTVDFWEVVPVEPAVGRLFGERDRTSSGPAVVVVSYAHWRDAMGADREAVGSTIPLNGEPHTVIGVLPEGFEFVRPAPFWLPLRDDVLAADDRSRIHYHLFGRLVPGATASDATRDLSAVMADIVAEHPGWRGWSVLAEPLHEASVLAVRPVLQVVTAAVVLVLLIALVNLTMLFRIRALGRAGELAVRRALGAGRARVARVLALEAGGLALVGALFGLLAAAPLLAGLRELLPLEIPIPESAVRLPVLRAVTDPWVMAAAVGLAVVGALALTLPASLDAMKRGGGDGGTLPSGAAASRHRSVGVPGTRGLVVLELALATVLCLGAVLTTRSAERLLSTDIGLEEEGLLSLYFANVWEKPIPEQVAYFEEVIRAVEAVPGVRSAALIDYVPFTGEDDYAGITFLDRTLQPGEQAREEWRRVTPGLIETAGMRLLDGRAFTDDDLRGPPRVGIVNESFARKHYLRGEAVGSFLTVHGEPYEQIEIVGVVGDVRSNGPAEPAPPLLYVPLQGAPRGTTGMYVRAGSGPPVALAEPVRRAIWSADAGQPVALVLPVSELVGAWVAIPRAVRTLVSGMALFALLLAGVGVFGVVAYAVRGRRAELGVKMALGASPERLRRDIMERTVPMVGLGVAVGLGAGLLAARAAGAVLHDVEPTDPVSVAAALAALTVTALAAVWLPARRIARIDPTEAMRAE